MTTDIFANLNERQRQAVEATEGRVKVVAGAGSGKTRVLAHRFAHLVNNYGIDPAHILCLTFTNKAAREMRSRIARLVGVAMPMILSAPSTASVSRCCAATYIG